jgi:hypothetical protein
MEAALLRWVAAQASLQFILGNPAVPRSMLPELQALWEEHQQQQKEKKKEKTVEGEAAEGDAK